MIHPPQANRGSQGHIQSRGLYRDKPISRRENRALNELARNDYLPPSGGIGHIYKKKRLNPKTTPAYNVPLQARKFSLYQNKPKHEYGVQPYANRRVNRNNVIHEKYLQRAKEVARFEEKRSQEYQAKLARYQPKNKY